MRNRTRLSLGLAVMVVAVIGASGLNAVRRGASPAPLAGVAPAQAATRDQALAANTSLSDGFRAAASRALPGVVHIQVELEYGRAGADPRQLPIPPFDDERRDRQPDPRPRRTSGSGFVLRSDGYILTNNHVVENARRIVVVTQDRHELPATLVGRDPNTDVAVIRVDAEALTEIPLADSDSVEVGDWVVALGYPLDLGSTATVGIVSAKGRNINILDPSNQRAVLESFLQTDAAINPGNSGGPLVDLEGRAVGMNSAIASRTGFFAGYGFAVPINLVRRVADDLIKYGEARRPQLGVRITSVDEADAMVYGLPSVAGVEVARLDPLDGPAAKAGLEQGDVIVSVNGRPVETDSELMELVARFRPGESIRVGTIRYGKSIDREIKLGQFEPAASVDGPAATTQPRELPEGVMRLGFTVGVPDSATAAAYGSDDPSSLVVILNVDPLSAAARALLQPGLAIEAVNRLPVKSVADLERVARSLKPGDAVSLLIRDSTNTRAIVNYIVR